MKQYKITNAYMTLKSISDVKLNCDDAYKLFLLSTKLRPACLFAVERERKMVEEYADVYPDGSVHFSSKEKEDAYKAAVSEIEEMDVDIDFEVVHLPISCMGGQTISVADFARLEGFVDFYAEERDLRARGE